MLSFLRKLRGGSAPPRASAGEGIASAAGAFVGMGGCAIVTATVLEGTGRTLLLASMAATAVLVHAAPKSPLAQPRNLVGGHLVSAVVGVACAQLLGAWPAFAAVLAVALAIAVMHATGTLHPPGGATAFLAVLGGDGIRSLGWSYVLVPVALGALVMLAAALVANNVVPGRRYPEHW